MGEVVRGQLEVYLGLKCLASSIFNVNILIMNKHYSFYKTLLLN